MAHQEIITGIDLGSKAIRIAVGQVYPVKSAEGGATKSLFNRVNPEGDLHIIGLGEKPSEGISKGVITSIEDTISSISACVEKVEKMVGLPIEHAHVGISGTHIISQESRGLIAVSRPDGEIREDDVTRALEAAQTVATPPNYEILHVLPRSFTVDNQPGIMDPVGMTGVRLEVDAQIILGLTNQIKNLSKCLLRAGIGIDELVFTILATAEAVLSKRQKELGSMVLNLGNTTTSLAVFEEGDILSAKILPIGARHITNDIAIGLRVPIDLAEAVKLNYGTSLPDKIAKHEQINFKDLDEKEYGTASKKDVAKIIEARCEEIFKLVDEELINIERSGQLPAGVVLTGAGAKLDGLVDTAKKVFKVPASMGTPRGFVSGINKAYDASFSTAVGLVLWGKQYGGVRGPGISQIISQGVGPKIKNWFKGLVPY